MSTTQISLALLRGLNRRQASFSRTFICALFLSFAGAFQSQTHAELVTFDIGANGVSSVHGSDLIGFSTASTSVSGSNFTVAMTASTINAGSIFRMNRNGLGVNSVGGDRPGQIDDRGGLSEGIEFTFSVSSPAIVSFVNIDLQNVAGVGNPGQDRAELEFAGGPNFAIDGSTVSGADVLTVNTSFSLSTVVSLRHIDGNGFRLQGITLDVTTVPEPSTALMVAFVIGFTAVIRKRWLTGAF